MSQSKSLKIVPTFGLACYGVYITELHGTLACSLYSRNGIVFGNGYSRVFLESESSDRLILPVEQMGAPANWLQ